MKRSMLAALTVYRKDMVVELRTRETLTSVMAFALVVTFVFNFTFEPNPRITAAVAPGVVWVAYLFTGMLGLNRTFILERDRATLDGLLMAPVGRESIFWGKLAGAFTIMLVVQIAMLPLFLILYNISLFEPWFALIVVVANIGFAAVGTLFSAISVHTRAREALLPLLLIPISLPLLIGAVSASKLVLDQDGWSDISDWIMLMAAFDAVFLVLSSWAFEFVFEE